MNIPPVLACHGGAVQYAKCGDKPVFYANGSIKAAASDGRRAKMTKLAGSSVARMLAMTEDPIPALRAYEPGLVTAVHEVDEARWAFDRIRKGCRLAAYGVIDEKTALKLTSERTINAVEKHTRTDGRLVEVRTT